MWVIFEGLDKAGKTTLEWELLKATNFKNVVIDRGPVGYLVFDITFGRNTQESERDFIKMARKAMKHNFVVVYCKANEEIVKERLESHNERCEYNYRVAQKLLDKCINRYYKEENTIVVDTGEHTIEECVIMIVKKIEEVKEK